MARITIAEKFAGWMPPLLLLKSSATLSFGILSRELHDGMLFDMEAKDFRFFVCFSENKFVVRRGDWIAAIPLTDFLDKPSLRMEIGWSPTEFYARCSDADNLQQNAICFARTPPIFPPTALITHARREALLPRRLYESDHQFYAQIESALSTIESKIEEINNVNLFWDISYEGKRILDRAPKHEEDVHSVIIMLLSDILLLSNIEIIPEKISRSGYLDFILLGTLTSGEHIRYCIECKRAHAVDIDHGITSQLPDYMKSNSAERGAYCIFWYKGPWFDQPREKLTELISRLNELKIKCAAPLARAISIHVWNLSSRAAASSTKQV